MHNQTPVSELPSVNNLNTCLQTSVLEGLQTVKQSDVSYQKVHLLQINAALDRFLEKLGQGSSFIQQSGLVQIEITQFDEEPIQQIYKDIEMYIQQLGEQSMFIDQLYDQQIPIIECNQQQMLSEQLYYLSDLQVS